MSGLIHHATAQRFMSKLSDGSVDLIYTDPPFGTGDTQTMTRKRGGKTISKIEYSDRYEDYLAFIEPHLVDFHRVLKDTGTLYLHLDWRWVHYVKVICDQVFGMENFLNDIVWSYNFGGRGKDRWPQKHDNILVYVKQRGKHIFNWEAIDRVPYTAPELQYVGRTREEAEKRIVEGQVPTDVWQMSIVGTASKERCGYPSQKPVKLVKRCIVASSQPGSLVVDPFAGSGTTAAACLESDRDFQVSDQSEHALEVMKNRFQGNANVQFV